MKNILRDQPDKTETYWGKNKVQVNAFFYVPVEGLLTLTSEGSFPLEGQKELLTLCSNDPREFDSERLFSAVVNFFMENPTLLELGGITPSLGPIFEGSELTTFYIADPYTFDDEEISNKFYWVFPISNEEVELLHAVGPDHFEEHLFDGDNPVPVFDYKRKSSI